MRWWAAAVFDLICVAVFVAIGRASHDEPGSTVGYLTTLWPFVTGLVLGWAVTRGWRRPAALVPTGVGVWLATVAGGMVLRALSGQGAAVAFVIVATGFVGATTLGWRMVAGWRRISPRCAAKPNSEDSAGEPVG